MKNSEFKEQLDEISKRTAQQISDEIANGEPSQELLALIVRNACLEFIVEINHPDEKL